MSLLSLCNLRVTIQHKATTSGAYGDQVDTWGVIIDASGNAYINLPATIQAASGKTIIEMQRRSLQVSHTIYIAPTAAAPTIVLSTGDRVVYGSDYYLVQWFEDQAGKGRVYAIHALKKS